MSEREREREERERGREREREREREKQSPYDLLAITYIVSLAGRILSCTILLACIHILTRACWNVW